MKEENVIRFFAENGFGIEDNVFIGSNNYAFLPFNGSLIVGRKTDEGLLTEGVFKDSLIRSLTFDREKGVVLIDVKEEMLKPIIDPLKKGLKAEEKPLEESNG